MDERQRRIGRNEILFREVNERLRELNESFSLLLENGEFVCECGDAACLERLSMNLKDYEDLRSHPNRFAVKPGHEIPDVERVLTRSGGYAVVEKHAGGPAELAVRHDPRSCRSPAT